MGVAAAAVPISSRPSPAPASLAPSRPSPVVCLSVRKRPPNSSNLAHPPTSLSSSSLGRYRKKPRARRTFPVEAAAVIPFATARTSMKLLMLLLPQPTTSLTLATISTRKFSSHCRRHQRRPRWQLFHRGRSASPCSQPTKPDKVSKPVLTAVATPNQATK